MAQAVSKRPWMAPHLRAKQVRQIGRNRGKAAAVHAQDDAARANEQQLAACQRAGGNAEIQQTAEHEEDDRL